MRRPSQMMKLLLTSFFGVIVGFLMGITFPTLTLTKATPDIVTPESDLYLRRLWGDPNEYIKTKQRYLVTFTVGYDQRKNIDAEEDNFTIMLFHYDGRASEWGKFEWSKRAIHVSIRKQTKWWYAKRFLHPDIVAPYEYIFIWDEDLGVEHFDSEKYLAVVKKHGLEISQPGLEPYEGLEVSIGRADHGLAQSNSFWAGYGRPQFINGSTGQKTNCLAGKCNFSVLAGKRNFSVSAGKHNFSVSAGKHNSRFWWENAISRFWRKNAISRLWRENAISRFGRENAISRFQRENTISRFWRENAISRFQRENTISRFWRENAISRFWRENAISLFQRENAISRFWRENTISRFWRENTISRFQWENTISRFWRENTISRF
ncbi:unnamed protein product, partial [Brassica oleracea]